MGFLVLTAIALAAALAALAVPSARRKAAGPRPSATTIVESELAGEFATMPATR